MKVVILAGGFGTRLAEYTDLIPKPMIEIGGHPVLMHLMDYYSSFGHNEFYVALGYKAHYVKQYFIDYLKTDNDLRIRFEDGEITNLSYKINRNWDVNLIDTGEDTMTGGRIKRLADYIGDEPFMLTYGDGLSDVDLDGLLALHKEKGAMVTVTAVRPIARFGEMVIDDLKKVVEFKEKPQSSQGWINGGFFVCEPKFLNYIEEDTTILEQGPLEAVVNMGCLAAYKHTGFWQCMDTKRDLDYLRDLWTQNTAPWVRS